VSACSTRSASRRLAEHALDADIIMIESEGTTENVKAWRTF
jgi:hypothetical protein